MFAYSPRENTKSYEMEDNIPDEVKLRRLGEVIELQRKISLEVNKRMIGKTEEILIESLSKKSGEELMGRTGCNKSTIVPRYNNDKNREYKTGEFVKARIIKSNSATLFGEIVD